MFHAAPITTISSRKVVGWKTGGRYIDIYNGLRPHGFLGNKTPNMAEAEYFAEHPTNLG